VQAATELAAECAVVTWEIEKISVECARAISRLLPIRPGINVLEMVQDRLLQKSWLNNLGAPVGKFAPVNSAEELRATINQWRHPARLKSRQGGYDGRSQIPVPWPISDVDLERAWKTLGETPCVLEWELDLELELSVLVARNLQNEMVVHPIAQNWHSSGILEFSVLPAEIPESLRLKVSDLALRLAQALELEGILVIECFLDRSQNFYVNELAPRPHNTFHTSESACITSQFEQHIRAICNLPLGCDILLRPTALANLLGDLWIEGPPSGLQDLLKIPGVQLRLYGKSPRPGRKIGHLLATSESSARALDKVKSALNNISVTGDLK
jgi:5-(carboxyamino)imidazole ribonucleotide synthase